MRRFLTNEKVMIGPWKTVRDKIPARFNLGILAFLICFMAYIFRANLSITILAMSKHSNASDPDFGPRYEWSRTQEGLLLGGFFWGSFISTVPGGFLAEWYGGKTMIAIALIISTVFTALTPVMCNLSFWTFYINRILIGIAGGVFYPALHSTISKWVPPVEKGKFVAALLGGNLGTVVIWQTGGIIITSFGWIWVYYGVAIITLCITLAWVYLVADSPIKHPRINIQELQYIEETVSVNVSKKKSIPPYLKIMTSVPFISLIILHYGSLWGLFFLLTAAPKFMSEVLQFNLTSAGILASLPHLARFLAGLGFGYIGDIIREKTWMTPTMIRKFFCIFSHVIPGLLLISIIFVGDNAYLCVGLITTSLGFNGAAALTNLQNAQDLAPNFAGTLYSIMNFIGMSSGFLSPLVVGHFTQERSTIDEWSKVLIIGGTAYIVPVLFFWIFGTTDVQSWNTIPDSTTSNEVDDVKKSNSETLTTDLQNK